MQQEINTDISQFLNSKQTFNHSLTGVTQTDGDGDKGAQLDRESNFEGAGGIRYSKGKTGSFIHEFSPRVSARNQQISGNQMIFQNPGSIVFNHNHEGSPSNRHTHSQRGGPQ